MNRKTLILPPDFLEIVKASTTVRLHTDQQPTQPPTRCILTRISVALIVIGVGVLVLASYPDALKTLLITGVVFSTFLGARKIKRK